jgi:hypothetical protein
MTEETGEGEGIEGIPFIAVDKEGPPLRPLKNPMWHEILADVSMERRYDFFRSFARGESHSDYLQSGFLGVPLQYDLEKVRVTFLTRLPTPVVEEFADAMKFSWFFGSGIPWIEAPLSEGDRIIVPDEEVKELSSDEKAFLKRGRTFEFDITNDKGDVRKLLPHEQFQARIEHGALRQDIGPFWIRVSTKGILYASL